MHNTSITLTIKWLWLANGRRWVLTKNKRYDSETILYRQLGQVKINTSHHDEWIILAFSEYFTNKIITIRNSFPPLNPTVDMDKITYSGKLLQTFTPVNEQFVGTRAVCFVQYSTFRHHSQSLSQPSAFWRRHPTSKINSTKWRAKPYTRPAIMYRWHKSMDVQQPTQT